MYFHPLNFLRFILALGVILFHYGVSYYPFNQPFLKTLIIDSSFRVSFFFFISGFVMCMVYTRQADDLKPSYFYRRRMTRIYPVYLLAFVVTLVVVLLIKNASPKGLNIILHGLGLQSLNPGHVLDLNYPTWSISVELIFYLLFPFLLKWMMQMSVQRLILISLTVWLLQSLQHILFVEFVYNGTKVSEEFISTFPLWHLPTFFSGMAASRLVSMNAFPEVFKKHALGFLLFALAVFVVIIYVRNPILKYVHNGLLTPLFMIVIAALYYDDESPLNKILSHRRVSSLGDFSYGLFIFQYPVWVICTAMAGELFAKTTLFFFIYLFLLFLVSWAVNRFFERPLLNKLRGQG